MLVDKTWFTDLSLYEDIAIEGDVKELGEKLRFLALSVETVCPKCRKQTVLRRGTYNAEQIAARKAVDTVPYTTETGTKGYTYIPNPQIDIALKCSLCGHIFRFVFLLTNDTLTKIGQYPTKADIEFVKLSQYEGILNKETRGELGRAIGLNAAGIGVGSFVYLRRVLEKLVDDHKIRFEQEGNEPIEGFGSEMPMGTKIEKLASVLPESLQENKQIYGILSKGVHQLDEQTCLKHFPVMLAVIMSILEDDHRNREEARRRDDLKKAVNAVSSELSGNDSPKPAD